ncbi:hypothetical protein BKA25_002597 [Actinoalloteichus hymeniacidonis]|nr:hypothetical protein [Actinoalloteichus hymeniacidonis]
MFDAVFDTADDSVIEYFACGADGEQVTESLVEKNFRWDSRVSTAENGREGVLSFDQGIAPGFVLMGMTRLPLDESGISLSE